VHAGLLPAIRHLHELHGLLQPVWNVLPLVAGANRIDLVPLPGLVFAGLTLVVTYRYALRTIGLPGACVALALLASNRDVALHAALGGDDIGWTLFSTLSIFWFVQSNASEARSTALAGLAAGLATLQKFSGFTLVLAFTLTLARNTAGRAVLLRSGWRLVGPSIAAVLLYLLRNYLLHGSIAFRYGGLDWLSKDDMPAYFAFYEVPPTVSGVLAQLGVARVLTLVIAQFGKLGYVMASNPLLFAGGPLALLLSIRQHPRLAYVGLIYTASLFLFTTVVYHVEGRYLFALFPVYACAIAAVATRSLARLEYICSGLRTQTARTAIVLASLALVGLATVMTLMSQQRLTGVRPSTTCSDAIEFLKRATPEVQGESILTSNPWYVNWLTGRPCVNAPTNGPAATSRVVRHYGVQWLVDGYGTSDLEWTLRSGALVVEQVYRGKPCSVYRIKGVLHQSEPQ
jgi:hypothetical protein